jgi:hypothetical protein
MTAKEGNRGNDKDKFGSGTPGNQGTYSVVGAQPEGGAAGLGAVVESGDGTPQDIAEAGGNPQHRNAPGPDSGEATASASESYDETEQDDAYLRTASGDRNTASGSSTQDLNA